MIKKVSKSRLNVEEEYIKESRLTKEAKSESVKLLSEEEISKLAKDDNVLENIIREIRNDSEAALDPNYRKIFLEAEKNNSKDILFLKQEIASSKEAFVNKIASGKGFDADISKDKNAQNKYVEIFGKRSKVISFQDYNTLLEMKQILEVKEQVAINGLEKI